MRTDKINVKKDDMIYCHSPVIMHDANGNVTGDIACIGGKSYKIEFIRAGDFYITDEQGNSHRFSMITENYNSRQWFDFPREKMYKQYVKKVTL